MEDLKKNKMKKKILVKKPTQWWFDPKLSWRTFKSVLKKFPESGPVATNGDKMLWEGFRERRYNIYIDVLKPKDPIIFTLKSPKGRYMTIREKK